MTRATTQSIDVRGVRAEVSEAAERLRAAAYSGIPCAPVRELIGRDDVAAAHAVQQELAR